MLLESNVYNYSISTLHAKSELKMPSEHIFKLGLIKRDSKIHSPEKNHESMLNTNRSELLSENKS